MKPIIQYLFQNGKAENSDGTYPGIVHQCTHESISLNLSGWDTLNNALVFTSGSVIRIPSSGRLQYAVYLAVEMVIKVREDTGNEMCLIEGKPIPFTLKLIKAGGKFFPSGSIHLSTRVHDFVSEQPVTIGAWHEIVLACNGSEALLLIDGAITARRVFYGGYLQSLGTGDYSIGLRNNGTGQFLGNMAGLRVWDFTPGHLLPSFYCAENSGIGEIESRYLDFPNADTLLGQPADTEKFFYEETIVSDKPTPRRPDKKLLNRYVSPLLSRSELLAQKNQLLQQKETMAHQNLEIVIDGSAQGPHSAINQGLDSVVNNANVMSQLNQPAATTRSSGTSTPKILARARAYQYGVIHWTPDAGAVVVYGGVFDTFKNYGYGKNKVYGFPLEDVQPGPVPGSLCGYFQNGVIDWSPATGGVLMEYGPVHQYYQMHCDRECLLGLPVGPHAKQVNEGCSQAFQNGAIFWQQQAGGHAVYGAILAKYNSMNGPMGPLGYPISDEQKVLNNGIDTGGLYSNFQKGTLFYSPRTGAFAVTGNILTRYIVKKGPLGEFGYPISDTVSIPGTDYQCNDFENGTVVYSPTRREFQFTELQLNLTSVFSGAINDGYDVLSSDRSAELITYTTIEVNGTYLENNVRRPGDYAGSSYALNIGHHIKPIRHDTVIRLTVRVEDWDATSSNDYLGKLEKTFDIRNLWGYAESDSGIFSQHPLTEKGTDTPSLDTIRFNFSLQTPSVFDPALPFREQYWWPFDNFSVPELSRGLYSEVFANADTIGNTVWERGVLNPLDEVYFQLLFKGICAGGACFGMCLEQLYAWYGRSQFTFPLSKYKLTWTTATEPDYVRDPICRKQAYQLGITQIAYIEFLRKMPGALLPRNVYIRIKSHLQATGEPIIVSFFDAVRWKGHSVLAYECRDGSNGQPHRIFVADPNVPYGENNSKDGSYIDVFPNNTFELVNIDQKREVRYSSYDLLGLIPMVYMAETPYGVLSQPPLSPVAMLAVLLGAELFQFIILGGEAEISQITAGAYEYYQYQGNNKYYHPQGIKGITEIPVFSESKVPRVYLQRGKISDETKFRIQGTGTGEYSFYFRTGISVMLLKGTAYPGSVEELTIKQGHTSRPSFSITTTQPAKTFQVKLGVIKDRHHRDQFSYNLYLPIDSSAPAGVEIDKSGGLLVKPSGPPRPIPISYEHVVNGILRRDCLDLNQALSPQETIAIQPYTQPPAVDYRAVIEYRSGTYGTVTQHREETMCMR